MTRNRHKHVDIAMISFQDGTELATYYINAQHSVNKGCHGLTVVSFPLSLVPNSVTTIFGFCPTDTMYSYKFIFKSTMIGQASDTIMTQNFHGWVGASRLSLAGPIIA